jgi:predicted ATPase
VDSVSLEGFRCFQKRTVVSLAPLTLLVGENSTGKSTFLASVRIASDIAAPRQEVDFNEEPFLLGAYDQIANYRGGRAGRAASFRIGARFDARRFPESVQAAREALRKSLDVVKEERGER